MESTDHFSKTKTLLTIFQLRNNKHFVSSFGKFTHLFNFIHFGNLQVIF